MAKRAVAPLVIGADSGRMYTSSYREDGVENVLNIVKDLLETGCHTITITQDIEQYMTDLDYYVYYTIEFNRN